MSVPIDCVTLYRTIYFVASLNYLQITGVAYFVYLLGKQLLAMSRVKIDKVISGEKIVDKCTKRLYMVFKKNIAVYI